MIENWDTKFVFPAYAGMSLMTDHNSLFANSFPRLRGDEPLRYSKVVEFTQFSPPTRG